MLLILAREQDSHVPYMAPYFAARGKPFRRLDPGDFPARARLTVSYGVSGVRGRHAVFDGEPLDLDTVRSVWLRQYQLPTVDERISEPDYKRAAELVSRSCLAGLSDALDVRWSPAKPRSALAAENKTHQLAVAPAAGFRVPRTVFTNEPSAALRFYEECDGRIITKLAGSTYSIESSSSGRRRMPTHPIRRRDLANFRALAFAPMILQEYVPKRAELRVIVVADRVFAALIDSQASVRSRDDWRHYDFDVTEYSTHELPPDVARACVQLLEIFQLRYGAIDLVLTPAGEYVFLELNPIGQWAWIQDLTGLPIADALADDLCLGLSP